MGIKVDFRAIILSIGLYKMAGELLTTANFIAYQGLYDMVILIPQSKFNFLRCDKEVCKWVKPRKDFDS